MERKLTLDNVRKGQGKEKAVKLSWNSIETKGVLSKAKIAIAKHPAKKKVILGAKGTGKSIIPIVKSIVEFENDKYFNAYGFRKYESQATKNMSELFYQSYTLLEGFNFEFKDEYEFKSQRSSIYKISNKKNMLKNQAFKFGSLDNASGSTDGGGVSNGGYYGIISVDEPVVEADASDPTKIPTRQEWDKIVTIILDNLSRANDNFEMVHGREVNTEIYFTMNNWGEHPLIQDIDNIFTEDEFIKWVFSGYSVEQLLRNEKLINKLFEDEKWVQSLKINNTKSVYDKENDTLYTRMTKFANPNNWKEKNINPLLKSIKKALLLGDKQSLTILLGTKTIPEIEKEMLVFNLQDYNDKTDYEHWIDKGFKPTKINYSWDIDTSRVLTLTPTIVMEKISLLDGKETFVFVDKQIELEAHGTGVFGELNDLYVKQMIMTMEKHFKALKAPLIKAIVSIDDKRKWYLNEVRKASPSWLTGYRSFEQHGMWGIEERQDMISNGIENKSIQIHKANKALVSDMQVCVKRDIQDPRRKTSGDTNYLDRLDSAENGIIPFAGIIWRKR